ncbi:DNA-binding protein [Leptospira ellisii]|uniref:DNA-binding protein n=1 Tax=Leptospira ellisii TaxID=2023197 RepID=A0A2N0B4H3_9LEPT|nr:DNA-binding protein [Leptospira ellisii]MDV6237548.1 DNA-binding protein [Leptospira ellisii]PJZ91452.1 hypothetical protein CH379_18570 [Leptospira ellisii]PKA05042.1 hypothetical protein CH375_07385 [Leptospira ellisii]
MVEIKKATVISDVIECLDLSWAKTRLLSLITDLDIKGRATGHEGCYAKNKSLGSMLGLAETTVSKYIRELTREGYLVPGRFHGHHRVLNSTFYHAVLQERKAYNDHKSAKMVDDINVLACPVRAYEAGAYESTGPNPNNTSTHQINNKENNTFFSNEYFPKLIERSKTLIIEKCGKYDSVAEKEKSKAKLWFKMDSKIEPVLESIQRLIEIKQSEEFKNDFRFWGGIPVNIASAYTHKDAITNTYESLVRYRKSVKIKSEDNATTPLEAKNQSEKYKPTWEGFRHWAKSRLTFSTKEILNQVKVKIEGQRILIFGDLPDSVKIIITKYFSEEVNQRMEIKYFKEEKIAEDPSLKSSDEGEVKTDETIDHAWFMSELSNRLNGSKSKFVA